MPHRPPALARRQFLHHSLAGLFVGGCGQIGGRAEQSSASPALRPAQGLYMESAPPPATSMIEAPACQATEPNIEGPFYRAGAPSCSERHGPGHCVLATPYTEGSLVTIEGRVLDRKCRALPGARIEIWHADHGGAYDNEGFAHRGRLETGAAGEYRVDTIIPGRYLNGETYRPAHIHVKIHAAGRPVLTTQLYFEGDPHNDHDPFIRPSLIMKLGPGDLGSQRARFDFVV